MQERSEELYESKIGLKRCLSQNGLDDISQIESVINRSRRAINNLNKLRENIRSYKGLYAVIRKLHSTD